jgi:tRNA (guanine-N7-)-methyltransferase
MSRKKQIRIDTVSELENVFQDDNSMKGSWSREYFGNTGKITLEIGCGNGQYVSALSAKFPEENFIGIDLKGARIWSAANVALEKKLKNAAFIVGNVGDLAEMFSEGEVDKIWITFPDPFPKPCKAGKRLTSPKFLALYKKVLTPGGIIHFKTDNEKLFDYSLEHIKAKKVIRDLHSSEEAEENMKIKTYYEKKYLDQGKPIYYMEFTL